MKCYTPQSLANLFQLVFVKKGFLWYGCEVVPSWSKRGWDINESKVSMILLGRNVLSVANEQESLTFPEKVSNEKE